MVKPSKPYAEWNKPIIKDHWHVSIYLKCQKQEKLYKKEISESGAGERESGQHCGSMNVSSAHLSLKYIQGTSGGYTSELLASDSSFSSGEIEAKLGS